MDIGFNVINPVINLFTQYLYMPFTVYGVTVTVFDCLVFGIITGLLIIVVKTLGVSVDFTGGRKGD